MSSRKYIQISTTSILPILVVLLSLSDYLEAQLQVGFYSKSCPMAENIITNAVRRGPPGTAPGLLRMHFHDCWVRGCDASVLIDSPSKDAEKDAQGNDSLRGFEVIDNAKAQLESTCPGVVSCADILAFAARDSAVMAGGFNWNVPAGRRDGRVSRISEVNLPPSFGNVNQLTQMFAGKGLNQQDLVTLSGAHTFGRAHCIAFSNRLYNFNSATGKDPTLNPMYASQLQMQCPRGNTNNVVQMDPITPINFDNAYYRNLLDNRGLFTSDQTLMSNSQTAGLVNQYAMNPILWSSKFSDAMVKMGNIGVLTGKQGEIRRNCRKFN